MKKLTLVLSASLALFCVKSQAHPYASGVTNNAGTITFHLNESVTNGQVYVLFDSGSVSNVPAGIPNNGSNVPRGVYSFSLGAHTNYSINIFNIGTGTPFQTSPNPAAGSVATNFDYFGPRGVAVNKNPKSPYFGTVYVGHGSAGTDTLRTTTLAKGVFAIYPDGTDRFGYGNTAKPAGMTYSASTTMSCYRVYVGPDDMVYLSDCSSGPGNATAANNVGNVYMISPDLQTVVGLFPTNAVLATEGQWVDSFVSIPRGSYAAASLELYTLEWDRSPNQSVWHYNFFDNSTVPATPLVLPLDPSTAVNFASDGSCPDIYNYGQNNPLTYVNAGISSFNGVKSDFTLGPDGRFYTVQPRNSPSQLAFAMYEAATNGACLLYDDFDATPKDSNLVPTTQMPFWSANSVAVSDDNQFIAIGIASSTAAPLNTNVNNTKILYSTFSGPSHMPVMPFSSVRYGTIAAPVVAGVAFDAADNLYGVSGSDDSMRAYTLGLTTLTSYSNDSTGTNGSFTLVTPGSQVSVAATQPIASQNHGSPTAGTFTLTRTGTASALSQPLTVNFALSGTATQAPWTNPVPFTASSTTSATFGANQTTTTVTINPVNDSVSRPTLTVNLNLQGSQVYSVIPPTSATVFIVNTGPQLLTVSAGASPTMYRSFAKDYATATLTRWGDTNANQYTVPAANFTYSGTAAQNTDYTALVQPLNVNGAANGSQDLTVNPGDVTVTAMVGNPIATAGYVGDKTIVLGLNSGGGYTAATNKATLTILDNHYQNENLIWSNALSSAADSTNWTVAFGGETNYTAVYRNYQNNAPNTLGDFDVEFGYSLPTDSIGLPPNGSTTALKVTVNKNATTGANCGVSAYPQIPPISGDYAVRFSMNLVFGTGTEYGQFGINHYGTNEQWWSGAGVVAGGVGNTNIDGIWYSISADQGGAAPNSAVGDLMAMVGQPLPNTGWLTARPPQQEASYINAFKHPVIYSANATAGPPLGSPANQAGGDTTAWTDVEIMQSNSVVTLSFNRTPIFVYTNKTVATGGNTGGGVYTSGVPMLGYMDPFRSIGVGGAVYYSNIRAVNLSTAAVAPKITNTQIVGNNVAITFTTTSQSDTTANFVVQSESALLSSGNTWPDVSPAAVITGGSGTFQASIPVNGTARFYRLRHN